MEKIATPETQTVKTLTTTARGKKGFGSTGISNCSNTIDQQDKRTDYWQTIESMIQNAAKDNGSQKEKIQKEDKKELHSYIQGVKRLGFDPIKHFPDVFPDKKPTELLPLRIINHKIDIINKEQYQQLRCRCINPKEAFMNQLCQKLDTELELGRIYPAQIHQHAVFL